MACNLVTIIFFKVKIQESFVLELKTENVLVIKAMKERNGQRIEFNITNSVK